ncbi:MAG: acyl carrier protein [Actinomycetota bacterium]
MTSEEILEAIREHLGGRGIERETVVFEAELTNDLDLDSLDTVELTLGLEKRFDIEIPDEELEDLVTVRDAVDLIAKKLSVQA